MAPTSLIDSHIHLWPEEASNENGHSWMTPGMPLAKQHVLSDYYQASESNADSSPKLEGVVYVETDRRYDTPTEDLATWAKGPLDEVIFVRDIVEGKYGERDSKMLLGIVLWAPMDQRPEVLEEWLKLAEKTAGPETWKRVKGFRFLLQAIHDKSKFRHLVLSEDFITNLRMLGMAGFSFDIGVDQRSGGAEQLELIFQTMELAHEKATPEEKVTFVINHLCKPDFSNATGFKEDVDFYRWRQAVEKMSHCAKTYMKLSGAFSELPQRPGQETDVAGAVRPWVEHVFKHFEPRRVMFGSDWPVCNVNGPVEGSPWAKWVATVDKLVRELVEPEKQEYVWSRTARDAYRLQ